MKVVYLLGSLNRGGTETLMLDVFRNAERCGLKASCVYRKGGVCETDFEDSGVPMHYLPNGHNPIGYLIRLRKRLLQEKASIVHAMQGIDALYAWLATRGTGIRVVQTLHGFDFGFSNASLRINRFILPRTELNLYVSYYQRNYYQDRYGLIPHKQDVLYNGISFDKLDQTLLSEPTIREEFAIPENVLFLGMVGNFNAVRDQETVCRFLKLLDAAHVDFRFVFVGKRVEGQEKLYNGCVNYCRQHGIAEKVVFAGVRQDVPAILKELDAFVYSTAYDTFGIAVVEAMASGVPVFVNDWGVMQEISRKGELATMYTSGEPQDLLAQFLFFLQNRVPYLEKAQRAAIAVRQTYSIEQHIARLNEIYNHL